MGILGHSQLCMQAGCTAPELLTFILLQMCMHQRFQRVYSWRGPARQRSQQMCVAGCCSTTSRHTLASWVRPALSSCNSIPAACRSHQCEHGCCVPGAGRLTKAAVPVPLLHGRSLGPICILTTLTHVQTPAAPVSQAFANLLVGCCDVENVLTRFLLHSD